MDERDDGHVDRLGRPDCLFGDESAQRTGADRRLVVWAVVGIIAAWLVAAIVIRDNLRLREKLDEWTGYAVPGRAAAVSRAAGR